MLKREDPYHPTSLVLNCDNYYFDAYQSGADYVMEDAYPVGINTTYSIPFDTYCNATHGDCGCDDCIGELQDVSNRLDAFRNYYSWLGEFGKPLWAVIQAFSGEGYWSRDPTPQETWAMMLLSFNHGAKGIMSWTFPASDTLNNAHAQMAKVATTATVTSFLLGSQPQTIVVTGHPLLDVSYWVRGNQTLIGEANLDYVGHNTTMGISLPFSVRSISSQPRGSTSWSARNSTLLARGVGALATSFVILDL